MPGKAIALWVTGLLTAVPYATWYLLFEAPREQYALLILFILFWVFGYWALVGPLLLLARVRRVFRALKAARSREDVLKTLHNADARAAAVDLIATENRIPRFLAERVYGMLLTHFGAAQTPHDRAAGPRDRPLEK